MVPIHVQTIHEEHPELSRRNLHRVMRASMLALGVTWVVDLLPEHFVPGARLQFGYAARKDRYLKIKQRQFEAGTVVKGRRVIAGRDTDLVYTGRLREEVLASAQNLMAVYPTRVTIGLVGPAYFTLRPRRASTARLAAEVLAVSRRQVRILAQAAERGFELELRKLARGARLRQVHTTRRAR